MSSQYLARVNPKYFAAIQLFAALNDVRYYLNGVAIQPHPDGEGVFIIATNGHVMGIMHDPQGWCSQNLIVGAIPRGLLVACTARPKKSPSGLACKPEHLWIGKDFAQVSSDETKVEPVSPFDPDTLYAGKIMIVDGKFPDWRKVIPKQAEAAMGFPAVNPKYLSLLDSAQKILTNDKWQATRLYPTGEGCSVACRLSGPDIDERFLAIIMPMRACEYTDMLPAQFRNVRQDHAPHHAVA